MEERLISFETAVLAKEIGFNEYCFYYYVNSIFNTFLKEHGNLKLFEIQDDNGNIVGYNKRKNSKGQPHIIIAPTQSLLQKHLREVYHIEVFVKPFVFPQIYDENSIRYRCLILTKDTIMDCDWCSEISENYEEIFEKGLFKALEIIKNKILNLIL
jgi:hypothetical protein